MRIARMLTIPLVILVVLLSLVDGADAKYRKANCVDRIFGDENRVCYRISGGAAVQFELLGTEEELLRESSPPTRFRALGVECGCQLQRSTDVICAGASQSQDMLEAAKVIVVRPTALALIARTNGNGSRLSGEIFAAGGASDPKEELSLKEAPGDNGQRTFFARRVDASECEVLER